MEMYLIRWYKKGIIMITNENLKKLEEILKEMGIVFVMAVKDDGIFYDTNGDRYIITGLKIKTK